MTTLITGGTGSFGHAYVRRHAKEHLVVLSRDEEKQRAMATRYPDVRFALGDVRDPDSLARVFRAYPIKRVFHAAALKQVPGCEGNVLEAVKTNILGTENVCRVAAESGARVVVLSTDKAVEPIGVMGASKFLAEGIARNYGFNSVRYGNILGSRGSILPIWRDQVSRNEPITITDPAMTRFVVTMDEAIDLVREALSALPTGSVFTRQHPAATVAQLADVFAPDYPTVIIGNRGGEKLHETLGDGQTSETAPRLTDDELAELIAMHGSGE
jgi:UDP-N-acetylglucosamine 4,6-dehydratase